MKSYYRYQIELNGQIYDHENYPGRKWQNISRMVSDRGGHAILSRQFVTSDRNFLKGISNQERYFDCGDFIIGPMETMAELNE